MKAARLYEYNEDIGTEPLKLEEVEEPKADGPLDVIVRLGGAGLCRTDLHIIEGQWAPLTGIELPYTPGHENSGWVEEVGSAVYQRGGRGRGHRASPHNVRFVSGLPGRRRHAL